MNAASHDAPAGLQPPRIARGSRSPRGLTVHVGWRLRSGERGLLKIAAIHRWMDVIRSLIAARRVARLNEWGTARLVLYYRCTGCAAT